MVQVASCIGFAAAILAHCRANADVEKRPLFVVQYSHADVAQPVEQRFRKPQVKGSSPFIGSTFSISGACKLKWSINKGSQSLKPFQNVEQLWHKFGSRPPHQTVRYSAKPRGSGIGWPLTWRLRTAGCRPSGRKFGKFPANKPCPGDHSGARWQGFDPGRGPAYKGVGALSLLGMSPSWPCHLQPLPKESQRTEGRSLSGSSYLGNI